jgi:hypothetical protein
LEDGAFAALYSVIVGANEVLQLDLLGLPTVLRTMSIRPADRHRPLSDRAILNEETMEAATALSIAQSTRTSVGESPTVRDASSTLAVAATYLLSEEGRKLSLLGGGNGRAVQELTINVPANRLHLVSVDNDGVARLKLRPRYQIDGERGITRIDVPPTYDAPPDLEELFREAARNHQLEEAFFVQRRAARTKRRDADRERRARIAQAFLADRSQRALVHPAPTEKRCYLSTENGRLLFDADTDEVPARQIPAEAHTRFRADLRERKERNRQARAEQLAIHEQKKKFIAEWIAEHGTPNQQARQAAGMLPIDDAVEAMADVVFAAAKELPRYERNGAARLQAYLRTVPRYSGVVVNTSDVDVTSCNARAATRDQWATANHLTRILPKATIVLREHTIKLRNDRTAPSLRLIAVLATCDFAIFRLRREFETV